MPRFELDSAYTPTADQPAAITSLAEGVEAGERFTTLLGATGTGKTMAMAGVVEAVQKPSLVIAHNKTLAAQLCNEFRTYFPRNAVEYFVSYYDYYQPEAYVPSRDLYIEKDSAINQEIDRLRHAATAALFARRDVLIVASVSCIFGLGSPETYEERVSILKRGDWVERDELLRKLVSNQYRRNDQSLGRGTFRVRGDTLEVFPAYEETAFRAQFFGDEVERLQHFDPLTASCWPTAELLPGVTSRGPMPVPPVVRIKPQPCLENERMMALNPGCVIGHNRFRQHLPSSVLCHFFYRRPAKIVVITGTGAIGNGDDSNLYLHVCSGVSMNAAIFCSCGHGSPLQRLLSFQSAGRRRFPCFCPPPCTCHKS